MKKVVLAALLLLASPAYASYQGQTHALDLGIAGLPTGGDDTAAINAVITAAGSGGSVHAPCGTYNHTGDIVDNGVDLFGDGPCTNFVSTSTTTPNPTNAIQLTGTAPKLHDLKVSTTWAGSRQSNGDAHAVWINAASYFDVYNLTVSGAAGGGIFDYGGSHGKIHDNIITSTLADAIHNTNGAYDISISNNKLYNPGDDCVAVVSYVSDGVLVHDIAESNNQCTFSASPGVGRGVSIVGGYNISVNGGTITNAVGCVYVASEGSPYYTYGVDTFTINGISENGCGSASGTVLASNYVSGRSGYLVQNGIISNISSYLLGGTGLDIGDTSGHGAYTSNITAHDNHLNGNPDGAHTTYGILVWGATDIDVHNNYIYNFMNLGIGAVGSYSSGFLKANFNDVSQVNGFGSASDNVGDAYYVNASGFSTLQLIGNTQENGTTTVPKCIYEDIAGAVIENNTCQNTTIASNGGVIANGVSLLLQQSHSPADNATCTAGTIWWDTGYIYVCTASGTVKRATLGAY